jgi:hypothetical protein
MYKKHGNLPIIPFFMILEIVFDTAETKVDLLAVVTTKHVP